MLIKGKIFLKIGRVDVEEIGRIRGQEPEWRGNKTIQHRGIIKTGKLYPIYIRLRSGVNLKKRHLQE